MGRKDRERLARIRSGEEQPRRQVTAEERQRMRRAGSAALQAMSTGNQVMVLSDSLHQGRLTPGGLRKALEENAHKEMRKGADKLRKKHKPVTVEALMEEYRKDVAFQKLAAEVGLDENWFVALAEKEC